MQSLAIPQEVIILIAVDHNRNFPGRRTKISRAEIVYLLSIATLISHRSIGNNLQASANIFLSKPQGIHGHNFFRFLKAWKYRDLMLYRILGSIRIESYCIVTRLFVGIVHLAFVGIDRTCFSKLPKPSVCSQADS